MFFIGVYAKGACVMTKELPAPVESCRLESPPLMSEAIQEVVVYIHLFQNLDLFQEFEQPTIFGDMISDGL